eukprot:TRINITY_DN17177_c0_g1_i2.p1 TRINITY_DN17177_c0_g1~~TRINITY_DN17177_c0_g1_i2.p1  ORF type:complete len:147 (+),score=30.56 TRINITY_DN17177_c0_g1_i2:381-821(+)
MLHMEAFTDRCIMHWQVAKQEGLPLLFIADCGRHFIHELKEQMELVDPELVECTWIKCSSEDQAEWHAQVVRWLKEKLKAATKTARGSHVSISDSKFNSVLPGQPDDSSSDDGAMKKFHIVDEGKDMGVRKTKLQKKIEGRRRSSI